MSFVLPPLTFAPGGGGPSGATGGSLAVPVTVPFAWNQVKNYQNHSSGSQSASASADPTSGGASAIGGLPVTMILLGAAAWLLLK